MNTPRAGERLRFVPQICNLLYRRIAFGRVFEDSKALVRAQLRRVQLCNTADCNSALPAGRRLSIALALSLILSPFTCTLRAATEEPDSSLPARLPSGGLAHLNRAWVYTVLTMIVAGAPSRTNASEHADTPPKGARELFNAGTERLKDGKLEDAQSLFRSALAQNDREVMPSALYNLGHTRYTLGDRQLKKTLEKSPMNEFPRAQRGARQALESAQAALAGGDMEALLRAYQRGRGARRDIREATKAIEESLKQFGVVLNTWERASADFRGADELGPPDTNAISNAELIDRRIAELIDRMRQEQQAMMAGQQAGKDLKSAMKEMRGRMPQEMFKSMPGGEGDDDEDTEEAGLGDQERDRPKRQQQAISQEQAEQLLRALRLDSSRTISPEVHVTKPGKREGGDW